MKTKGKPDKIDAHVGRKLFKFRLRQGMSQKLLASKVGVTYQQIQKYEKGLNRIAASRLYAISKALNTPIQDFFPNDGGRND